jgi:hypothetical protein
MRMHAMLTLLLASLAVPTALAQELSGALTLADEEPSDIYIIQDGDTLWDIASLNMGNPYYWARLWSINNYITNPHWIYPGSNVIFTPGTLLEPPQMDLEQPDSEDDGYKIPALIFGDQVADCGPDIRFDNSLRSAVYMAPSFLTEPSDVDELGTLFGAKTGMTSLGEGDMVYLKMVDIDAVECGDVFAIVREGEKVKHPELKRLSYGSLFQVIGEVRVVHKEGDVATAFIRNMYRPAYRGDIITGLIPVAAEMSVRAPRGDLEGTIVARGGQDLYDLASTGEVVFLDRGKEDGLRIGNTFYVIKRQDLYVSVRDSNPELPAAVVGRIVVTRVEDYSATGVVVNSSQPIRVGDSLAQTLEE